MNLTESESNNLRNVADTMNVGDTMTGKLSTASDVDCFKVIFSKNANVTFELDIPAGTDYRIRVYTNDNSGENYTTQDIRLNYLGQMRCCLTYIGNTTDVYYICISVNTSGLYNANSNYKLRVFYSNNELITDTLEGYRSNNNGKYWNAGLTESSLSASNWGVTTTPCPGDDPGDSCTSNYYGSAWQCAGFALFLAKVVFNDLLDHAAVNSLSNGSTIQCNSGNWTVYKGNVSNRTLKPGDIIRKSGHSAMILKVSGSIVTVVEVWGSIGCEIAYGYYNGQSSNMYMSTLLSGNVDYLLVSPIKKVS